MALVFIVACAAAPTKTPARVKFGANTTENDRLIFTNAMECKTSVYVKICTNTDEYMVFTTLMIISDMNCPTGRRPTQMNSVFAVFVEQWQLLLAPKNFEHIASRAASDFLLTEVCKYFKAIRNYLIALDIYFYECNFIFNWWSYNSPFIGICTNGRLQSIEQLS